MKDATREFVRIHKRIIAPLKKALEAAIVRAARKNCWYDPWNRRGNRADYGILYEYVDPFIKAADVADILSMVEFLLEKAKRQIEHSNDDGDCAGQARYWAHKLVKAAVKKNYGHIPLIDWAIGITSKDIYLLTDAETIVLEKNNTTSAEVWNEIANHYKGTNRRVYLLALKKAGKTEERQKSLKAVARKKRDYAFLIDDALSRGSRAEALELCEQGLSQDGIAEASALGLRFMQAYLKVAEGRYDQEFDLLQKCFERDQSISNYEAVMELAVAIGRESQSRIELLTKLESSKKWDILSQIALREYRLMDAARYYWETQKTSSGVRCGYEPYKFDLDLADRLSRVYPAEAEKVLRHIVDLCLASYMPDYESVNCALHSLKPVLFVQGRSEDWTSLLESLRTRYRRKRNLMEIIDGL